MNWLKKNILKIQNCNKEIRKNETYIQLPLDPNVESTTYLFYSTRLAILQATENYKEWLKQYMMHIAVIYNKSYTNFYYFDEKFEDSMYINGKLYRELPNNIVKYIKEQIRGGLYVNIHLDDYYLSEKDRYEKSHFVHENLIYGFDDNKKSFMAFGFAKRQKTTCFYITYDELKKSYKNGRIFYRHGAKYLEQPGYYPFSLYCAKQREKMEFTIELFLEKLNEFLHPKKTEQVEGDIHIYGSNIYEKICRELTDSTDELKTVDLRTFHLLYEQKIVIRDRISFIMHKYHLNELLKVKEDYEQIVDRFRDIRLVYLKQLYQEDGYEVGEIQRVYSKEVNNRIGNMVKNAQKEERKVLLNLEELLQMIIKNNITYSVDAKGGNQ